MTTDYIVQKVNQIIEHTGTRNPQEICEQLRISVIYRNLHRETGGLYYSQSRGRYIMIDDNISMEFQRTLLAHELGHAVLHQDLAIMKGNHFIEFDTDDINHLEYEANIFAAELLLEDSSVLEDLFQYTISQAACRLEVPEELLVFKLRLMNKRGLFSREVGPVNSAFLKNIERRTQTC